MTDYIYIYTFVQTSQKHLDKVCLIRVKIQTIDLDLEDRLNY